MDYWLDIAFAVILRAVKSKETRATMRRAFVKLINAIAVYYRDDSIFWETAIVELTKGEPIK